MATPRVTNLLHERGEVGPYRLRMNFPPTPLGISLHE
jgi:hypothetical protein